MKTTIELSDELAKQARQAARAEGTTLRALVEEGLQRSLEARRKRLRRELDFPTFGGSGLASGMDASDWNSIRSEIYRDQGA